MRFSTVGSVVLIGVIAFSADDYFSKTETRSGVVLKREYASSARYARAQMEELAPQAKDSLDFLVPMKMSPRALILRDSKSGKEIDVSCKGPQFNSTRGMTVQYTVQVTFFFGREYDKTCK